MFDAKQRGGGVDAGGKNAAFLPKTLAGLLDAVAILGGHDGGGKTTEGDDKVMGSAERGNEPSDR